jgi:hypothetical protein
MNKLSIIELEEPLKLAEALGCEMVELANEIRKLSVRSSEVMAQLDRCLLLAGLAAGTILKLDRGQHGRRLDKQEHRERHAELHRALDELASDYMIHTGRPLSDTTVLELVEWSHEQTKKPTEVK